MKQIVIGDIHGRNEWQIIVNENKDFDRVIFIGDYLDAFDRTPEQQIANLQNIITFKKKYPGKVILLVGNHDHHYFPGINNNCSGYQYIMRTIYEQIFKENISLFQMVFIDEYKNVYSHAGITETFMNENNLERIEELNDLFVYQQYKFNYNEKDRTGYGDNIHQGPIWVRPKSLLKDTVSFTQIVGHTIQDQINKQGNVWFIDTALKEYLVVEDGVFNVKKL